MRTIKFFSILVILLNIQSAQADLVSSDILNSPSDEAIIANEYFAQINLEDPVFSSRKFERDVAKITAQPSSQELEQGQLVVVKEIPYSYAWLSRRTLQLRTLNELEEKEKAQKDQ